MHKELRDRWCSALRSGEYNQSKEVLYNREEDGYCCLGVLGVIHGANLEAIEDENIKGFPNKAFLEQVGLFKENAHELAGMNDNGYDFLMIAKHIEESVWVEGEDDGFDPDDRI